MAKRKRKTVVRDGIMHSYRKVIQLGGAVVVSIPKMYCDEHGIKAGDTLALTANSIISMVKKAD